MKILSIAEFDAAGVAIEHRDALRALGVDYRLAVQTAYRVRGLEADWVLGVVSGGATHRVGDLDALHAFAAEADLLQFHPAISQGWSQLDSGIHIYDDLEFAGYDTLDWRTYRPRAKIAYVHGSRNAAVNAETYRDHYRELGYVIWASTLDYVDRMGATYAPPLLGAMPRAPLRGTDDPLVVIQAPTDLALCATDAFTGLCQKLGILYRLFYRAEHGEVLRAKTTCSAGFDHLRGAFSVNTLENAAIGLVPLVGIRRPYLPHLAAAGLPPPPFPAITTLDDLGDVLRLLRDDPDFTAKLQRQAHRWYHDQWAPRLALRLKGLYEELLA